MSDIREVNGHPLRVLRTQYDMTLEELAHEVGVAPATISRAERGCGVSPSVRKLLCKFFKKTSQELGLLAWGKELPADPPVTATSMLGQKDTERSTQKQEAPSSTGGNPPISMLTHEQDVILSQPSNGALEISLFSAAPFPLEPFPDDCATWFSERLAQIITMISFWSKRMLRCADLQQLLNLELHMFDDVQSLYDAHDYAISRRNALLAIASLPFGLLSMLQAPKIALQEELLPLFASSITACWHLLSGREFSVVERALTRYFPVLMSWSQQSSTHQREAAYLAAQANLILCLLALHQLPPPKNFQQRLTYCKKAVECAKIAGDSTLSVVALIHLAGALHDLGQTSGMLQTLQQAELHIDQESPLLQSKLYAELAYAYAKNGRAKEALSCSSKARALFPGEVKDAPSYLSIDYGLFFLILYEGQTYLDLGIHEDDTSRAQTYYKQSEQALAQIETVAAPIVTPERFRVEIINQRTAVAIHMKNIDDFRTYLIAGLEGAKNLASEKRRQEVIANWKAARQIWPNESQVLELADLLV